MAKLDKDSNHFGDFELPLDFIKKIDFDQINFEKEAKYIGALTGSVVGSFVSTQLSWSLGLRLVSVIGGSYTGAFLATMAYQVIEELASEEE